MKKDSMLAKLLGSFGAEPADATAVASEATATLQAEFDAFKATAEANAAELSSALEKALTAVSNADQAVADAQAQVAALTAELASFKEQAEAKRLAERKKKIVEAIGTARADAVMESLKNNDDATFESMLAVLKISVDTESQSKMFTAQGADGAQADATQTEESETMRIVKARVAAGLHTA